MWSMGRTLILTVYVTDSNEVVHVQIQPSAQHMILVLLVIIKHTRKEADMVSTLI